MPVASLTLTDTGTEATAVYLAHNLPEPRYDEALAQLMKTQGVQHMTWRPGDRLQVAQGAGQSIVVGGIADGSLSDRGGVMWQSSTR